MVEISEAFDGDTEAETATAPDRSKKRLLIIVAAALFVLVAGCSAAFVLLRSPKRAAAEPAVAESAAADTYIDVPTMVVNLRSADGAARLIKLHLMLVPATAEKGAALTARLPVIIDRFQPFLRELRPEDLAGSAAIFRIKEELLVRANDVTGPGSVKDILIQDLIQQ